MKKLYLLVTTVCAAFMLTACYGEKPTDDSLMQEESLVVWEEQGKISEDAVESPFEEPEAEIKEELVYTIEGMEEREAASRYHGTNYSILIPLEYWEYVSQLTGGKTTDSWKFTLNDKICLSVISLGDTQEEEAKEWVKNQYSEYNLEENELGELLGTGVNGQDILAVRIVCMNETYAVACFYPLEAAEGAGSRMRVMADSFVCE